MIDAHETFGGSWPFEPRFFEGSGFRMHCVDEGSGEPIVCMVSSPGDTSIGVSFRRFPPRTGSSFLTTWVLERVKLLGIANIH